MHRMPCHPGLPATGRHRHRPQPAWAHHHAIALSWMERFCTTIADQRDFETRPRSAAPRADASPVPLAHGGNPRRMPPHIAQRTPAACHAQRHARHKGTRRIHLRHAFPCSPPMIETLRRVRDAAIDGIMLRPCTLTVADDSRRATAPGQQGFPGVHLRHAFSTPATADRHSETPPRRSRGQRYVSARTPPRYGRLPTRCRVKGGFPGIHPQQAFPRPPPLSETLRHRRDVAVTTHLIAARRAQVIHGTLFLPSHR